MKTLEQIKDDYAIQQGFQNWIHLMQYHILIDSQHVLDAHFNNVTTITQKECLKLASENSKVLVEGILTEERKTLFTLFDKGVKGVVQRKVSVCRGSITNENNILK